MLSDEESGFFVDFLFGKNRDKGRCFYSEGGAVFTDK